jgi:hypothetical protein
MKANQAESSVEEGKMSVAEFCLKERGEVIVNGLQAGLSLAKSVNNENNLRGKACCYENPD